MKGALPVLLLMMCAFTVTCIQFEPSEVSRTNSSERDAFEIRLAQDAPQPDMTPMLVEETNETIYVASHAVLKANDVKHARVVKGRGGQPAIGVMFTEDGARRLADFTAANTGKRAAFLLKGRVVSAPTILDPITDGLAIIEGSFTKEEALRLARLLSGD